MSIMVSYVCWLVFLFLLTELSNVLCEPLMIVILIPYCLIFVVLCVLGTAVPVAGDGWDAAAPPTIPPQDTMGNWA